MTACTSALYRHIAAISLGLSMACGPTVGIDDDDDEPATTQPSSDDAPAPTTAPPPPPPPPPPETSGTTAPADSGDSTTTSPAATSGFITRPDGGVCSTPEGTSAHCSLCDTYAQDCPRGEKCNPWANDGGDEWNTVRCVPVADDPGQPGDACIAEFGPTAGFDDCDLASMCWDVDPDTNEGVCVAMCVSENPPLCADADLSCVIANDGVLTLCLPRCNPLASDCPEGNACVVVNDEPVCMPEGQQPCGAGTCGRTEVCIADTQLADCADAECCTAWCDLDAAEPDLPCAGVPGHVCVPYPSGGPPNLGYCGLP